MGGWFRTFWDSKLEKKRKEITTLPPGTENSNKSAVLIYLHPDIGKNVRTIVKKIYELYDKLLTLSLFFLFIRIEK